MYPALLRFAVLALLWPLLAGCSDGPAAPVAVDVVELRFSAALLQVPEGEDRRLELQLVNGAGRLAPPPPGTPVRWSSSEPQVARVDDDGSVVALRSGQAVITASLGVHQARADVHVLERDGSLVAGAPFTLGWGGFAPAAHRNRVTVDGVEAEVLSATDESLRVQLPAAAAFPCLPARPVEVRVVSDRAVQQRTLTLRVAAPVGLQAGEALLTADAESAACLELEPAASYGVVVVNTQTVPGATTAFRLHGAVGHVAGLQRAPAAARLPTSPAAGATPRGAPAVRGTAVAEPHRAAMEASRRLLERFRPEQIAGAAADAGTARFSVVASAPPAGSVVRRRVAVLDDGRFGSCTQFREIDARVVRVHGRVVILEEAGAPIAGAVDSLYAALAAEFDERMLPMLARSFGDLDALPARRGGRVEILFSRRVNLFGAGGFVWTGDLVSPTACPASNGRYIMYLPLPAGHGEVARWWRNTPGAVVHEAKHLISYAERLSRGLGPEESWLEEATARIAEEIWGREVHGYRQGGNTTAAEAGCALRASSSGCAGRPPSVNAHFAHLRDVFVAPERRTPFGDPGDDLTFYGNAWWLVRYAADHSGRPEAEFLRSLLLDARRGMDNLAAQAGMTAPQLLGHWSLATLLDDRPGLRVSDPRHRHPSWNARDVLAELAGEFPLDVRHFIAGFTANVGQLRAGAAWYAQVRTAGPQTLMLQTAPGGPAPAGLRLGVARLE